MKPVMVCSMALLLAAGGMAGCSQHAAKSNTPAAVHSAPLPAPISLAGDDAFAFGKSGVADLQPGGRSQLDQLAAALKRDNLRWGLVRIVGHSDRIGAEKANLALSTRRAQAVSDYLIQQGLPAAKIVATGRGPYQPLVECRQAQRKALIACLAPNRRVEISVDPQP